MKKIAALVALAGIASAASAVNQIDIKARIVGTTDWLDSISFVSVDSNAPLNLEVAVFYKWDNGVALSGVTHSVVTNGWNVAAGDTAQIVDNASSASHPDGRVGNFNFGGQAQAFFTTGIDAGRLRIGAPSNTGDVAGGGISIKQNTPVALGAALDTSNPALGYRFNISIACDDTDNLTVRNMSIDAPLNKVSSTYGAYASLSGTAVNNNKAQLLATDGVSISANWITTPAPGAMALLGLGGLVVGRRRR